MIKLDPIITDDPASRIQEAAEELVKLLRESGFHISFAESCTGGLIAKCLTDVAGASDVFECSFVTYSNDKKRRLLGVDEALLCERGPVNEETAAQMAAGAARAAGSDLAVGITGVAGPGPDGDHPEGEIYIALYDNNETYTVSLDTKTENRRDYNRQLAALNALCLAEQYMTEKRRRDNRG